MQAVVYSTHIIPEHIKYRFAFNYIVKSLASDSFYFHNFNIFPLVFWFDQNELNQKEESKKKLRPILLSKGFIWTS